MATRKIKTQRTGSAAKWSRCCFFPLQVKSLRRSSRRRLRATSAQCADCSAALDREKELVAAFARHRQQPDAALLASCRASLEDALDREEEGGWLRAHVGLVDSLELAFARAGLERGRAFGHRVLSGHARASFAASPWSGSRLLRTMAMRRRPRASLASSETASRPSSSVPSSLDFHTADVAGMNVLPSIGDNPAEVQLQLKAQEPVTVQGTVNDDNVKGVLLHILGGNEAFCPDMRLQAVDLLRMRNNDPEVRKALCHAVHEDRNAAVRLKALEALNGSEPQDIVRQTLLDALVDDQNPGVRVQAINELRDMAAKGQVVSDDHMISVLRDRMEKDPSTYIRLQSAAAIRDLGPGH